LSEVRDHTCDLSMMLMEELIPMSGRDCVVLDRVAAKVEILTRPTLEAVTDPPPVTDSEATRLSLKVQCQGEEWMTGL
jgi:hypothetical protein